MKQYQTMIVALLLGLLLTLSITACTKAEKKDAETDIEDVLPTDAEDTDVVEEPATEPTRTVTGTTTPPRTVTPTTTTTRPTTSTSGYTDSKVKKLMDKASTEPTSYAFYFQTSDNWNLIRDQYFIRDNRVKIKLFEINFYNRKHYFDTVYLDMTQQTGYAYCESRGQRRCSDPDREFLVEYSDFIIKTPMEWMREVPYNAAWVGTEQIDNRAADIIEYERNDGTTVRMKVDAYSGVPREIWVYQGSMENVVEKYAFRDFAINAVKESDMDHQFN